MFSGCSRSYYLLLHLSQVSHFSAFYNECIWHYMIIYIYIWLYIYIYTWLCIYIYTHDCIYIYDCIYICMYIYIFNYVYIYICICTYIYTYSYVYTHTSFSFIGIYMPILFAVIWRPTWRGTASTPMRCPSRRVELFFVAGLRLGDAWNMENHHFFNDETIGKP